MPTILRLDVARAPWVATDRSIGYISITYPPATSPAKTGYGIQAMLNFVGPRSRFCDNISRRSFLQVGGWALGGLTLPALLRAEAASGRSSHKSVIVVYLSGGLSHQDTFDLKPNAPERSAWRILANPLGGAGRPGRRTLADDGEVHGSGRPRAIDRRTRRRTFQLAKHVRRRHEYRAA